MFLFPKIGRLVLSVSGKKTMFIGFSLFLLTVFSQRQASAQTPGYIYTVAGNGSYGAGVDGVAATSESLQTPIGVVVNAAGDFYFIDYAYYARVRKVDHATGVITTVAGNGTQGYNGDNIAATSASLNLPQGLALDSANNLFIADYNNHRIRRVDASTGVITTVYDFSGFTPQISPTNVLVDPSGNVFISYRCQVIEAAVGASSLVTVAGNGQCASTGDGGSATNAEIDGYGYMALDGAGNLYVDDYYKVRKVNLATGIISTLAGTGMQGSAHAGDGGAATSAPLGVVDGIATNSLGDVYILDGNSTVQLVTAATGIITTVAGDGNFAYSGDGGPAVSAEVNTPKGITVDSSDNVLFADSLNNRVRKIYH